MELFGTHFVWFGQVLAVSGQKTLAIQETISDKITTVPRLFSEQSLQNENLSKLDKMDIKVPFSVYVHNLMFVFISDKVF